MTGGASGRKDVLLSGSEERPWLAHYAPQVPQHISLEPLCLHERWRRTADAHPSRDALVLAVAAAGRVFTSRLSFAQAETLIDRFAASLQRLGVQRGDRVGLFLPNCPQFVIAYLATLRIGGIAVPFNPLYSARETELQLNDCGARIVVTLSQFHGLIKRVQPKTSVEHIVVSRLKEYFSPALWLLFTLTRERKEEKAVLGPKDLWFQSLLGPGTPSPVAVSLDDTATLLYTGGTTGTSKGVELTHKNLVVNAEQNRAWARVGDGCESTLAALPLFHAFGLTCGLNLTVLSGTTLILVPNPRDVPGLLRIIDRLRPTIFPVVPTLLVALADHPQVSRFNLRSVRVSPCAGAPLAPAVQRRFIERTGVHPCEGYGLTEASPVTHGNPPFAENRHGTIGLPYPVTVARIVDLETGKHDVGFEEGSEWSRPGELVVRGPQLMKGYWKRPQETAAQVRDGWLHTGDIGQMHRDGYFRVVDRLKDMIIRGGLNVYPAEVEAVLQEHPKIREALVIGVPDERQGERVKAFVVPRAGVHLLEEEVLAFCRENLAKYKVPSLVEIRPELPRSAVGKPLRRLLREEKGVA